VEAALLESFKELFAIRDNDKDRNKWRRLLNMTKPTMD